MNTVLYFACLAVSTHAAVIQRDANANENSFGRPRGIVRVMPDGPKVAIKSTPMKTGSGRLRNSDFHEVFLAPFRYLEKEMQATALLTQAKRTGGETESSVQGTIRFSQAHAAGSVTVSGLITGLTPGKHGLHVHEFGDLSENCHLNKVGRHYNPFKSNHGSRTSAERHAGDLGNIEADATGTAYINITDSMLSLVGGRSIIGRSVVVDSDVDDFSPFPKETSSQPMACGVIGRTG